MSAQRPPLVPRLLLVLLLFGAEREVICGDLEEEFRTLLDRGDGARMARRWYRRQAWKALGGEIAGAGAPGGRRNGLGRTRQIG